MASKKTRKNEESFYCETCDFKCSYKSDFNRHLMTAKHKMASFGFQNGFQKNERILPCEDFDDESIKCACGMVYKHRQSLYKHQKKCRLVKKNEKNEKNENATINLPIPENRVVDDFQNTESIKNYIHTMFEANNQATTNAIEASAQVNAQAMESNNQFMTALTAQFTLAQESHIEAAQEQTRQLVEAISLKETQIITNNNNNTTNNQFNLNVFLNEDCKDAYTLKDVINTIECTVTDLDRMDKDGYAATVVRKIMESIQDMSITERPIHCTDARRNTVCVKNETGWERNEAAMKSLNNSVYKVGRLLGNIVDDWRETYPDHFRGSDSRREQYHRLITNILKVSDGDVEARIASKVCKGVILDRKSLKN